MKKGIDLVDENLKSLLAEFIKAKSDKLSYHVGKVVDNNDPTQQGRCRVRVYGIHSDVIPDEDIPWAIRDSSFVGGLKGSFVVPPKDALVNVIFQDGDIYNPQYTSKVVKKEETFSADHEEDYPNSMIFFETDDGEYFKINRKTKVTTYRHASGSMFTIDDQGNIELTTTPSETGNITINTGGNIEVNCGGSADVISDGDVTVQSTTGNINLGGGATPINNLKNCLYSGAPHYTPSSVVPGQAINVSL